VPVHAAEAVQVHVFTLGVILKRAVFIEDASTWSAF
jgi:hypothetical protein